MSNTEEDVDNQFNDLISQLKQDNGVEDNIETPAAPTQPVTEDDLGTFLIDKASQLVNNTVDIVDTLKDSIIASDNAEDVAAMAELIRSSSSAIDNLNKIYLQNKKAKVQKEIKQMEIDSRVDKPDGQGKLTQNNIFISTREKIFERILEGETIDTAPTAIESSDPKTIEAEVEVVEDEKN